MAPGCHGNTCIFPFAEKSRRSTGCARLCFVQQLDLGWLLTALNTRKSPACQSLGAAGVTDSADYKTRKINVKVPLLQSLTAMKSLIFMPELKNEKQLLVWAWTETKTSCTRSPASSKHPNYTIASIRIRWLTIFALQQARTKLDLFRLRASRVSWCQSVFWKQQLSPFISIKLGVISLMVCFCLDTVILQIFGALKFRWRAIAERSV